MKKTFAMLFCLIIVIALACTAGGCTDKVSDEPGELSVVTTIFPLYDWVKVISGEDCKVTMLLQNGVDLHSYQPSVEDFVTISQCDLLIYVGGESDEWVSDALKNTQNPDQVVINLMDVLGEAAKTEETVEGMEPEEEEEEAYDEHIWLSLKNAQCLTDAICTALTQINPVKAETYATNLKTYQQALSTLEASYQEAVEHAAFKTILFGDRFPFRYLTDDLGLSYYAAFVGCSAETEASFETITFLSKKIDELQLPVVLTLEDSDRRLAETVVRNTKTKDQKILTMDSIQSVTQDRIAAGIDYLSLMKENLNVLKEALQSR